MRIFVLTLMVLCSVFAEAKEKKGFKGACPLSPAIKSFVSQPHACHRVALQGAVKWLRDYSPGCLKIHSFRLNRSVPGVYNLSTSVGDYHLRASYRSGQGCYAHSMEKAVRRSERR